MNITELLTRLRNAHCRTARYEGSVYDSITICRAVTAVEDLDRDNRRLRDLNRELRSQVDHYQTRLHDIRTSHEHQ